MNSDYGFKDFERFSIKDRDILSGKLKIQLIIIKTGRAISSFVIQRLRKFKRFDNINVQY